MFTGSVRQPESGQLGALGETAVKREFIRLGWGAAEAQSFDVGTDLLLLVRDERLFDARLVIGAQVKTGASFFDELAVDEHGAASGGGSATVTAGTSTTGSATHYPTC